MSDTNILGTITLDDRAMERNGTTVTVTLTNIPVVTLFSEVCGQYDNDIVVCPKIISGISAFRAFYRGSELKKPIVVDNVLQYRVTGIGKHSRVDILKFQFTDESMIATAQPIEIPIQISRIMKFHDMLAIVFTGGFHDITWADIDKLMKSKYSLISHLGITYRYVNILGSINVKEAVHDGNNFYEDTVPHSIAVAFSAKWPCSNEQFDSIKKLLFKSYE